MKIPVFVWKKSLENDGICTVCGKLLKKGMAPTDNCVIYEEDAKKDEMNLYCGGCMERGVRRIVATVKYVDRAIAEDLRMYEGLDWDAVKRKVNREARVSEKRRRVSLS